MARLHRGDSHGVQDVRDFAAARQVVDRPRQALQHWPNRNGARALLHRLHALACDSVHVYPQALHMSASGV